MPLICDMAYSKVRHSLTSGSRFNLFMAVCPKDSDATPPGVLRIEMKVINNVVLSSALKCT